MSSVASPLRAPWWEWAQVAILAANLAWTTLCLGGYRPETMVITTSLTGLLVAVHLTGFAWRRRVLHPAGWLFLPFVAYAAGNVAWVTPVRWLGWMDWAGWAQMIAIFWVVLNGVRAPGPRKALFGAMIGIAAVTVLMACYQRWVQPSWLMLERVQASQYYGRASGSFGIPNSLAAFLLLFLPALGAIGFRRGASPDERRWGRILTGMLAVGFVLTISRGGWIALVLALGAWPLLAVRGHWWRRVRFAVAAFGASLVAAGLLLAALPNARERFLDLARSAGERSRPIMWRASWELFRAEPVWGTGGGSYNVLFERHRPEQFNDEPQWAHNDYLNTLSDYGAVGFGLFFGPCAAVAIGSVVRRRADSESAANDWIDEPLFASGLLVGLLAFAVQLFVDFHFKIPALAMAFATVGALAAGRLWPARNVPTPRATAAKLSLIGVGLGALGVTAFGLLPLYRGEALRYRARQAIDHLAIARPGQDGEQEPAPWIVEELVQAVG